MSATAEALALVEQAGHQTVARAVFWWLGYNPEAHDRAFLRAKLSVNLSEPERVNEPDPTCEPDRVCGEIIDALERETFSHVDLVAALGEVPELRS